MAEVELVCAVYGEATVFPLTIACNATVSALQKAIFQKKRYEGMYPFDDSALTLYVARKKGEATWLKDDDSLDILLREKVDATYTIMRSTWRLNKKELFGPGFQPQDEEIHVLVELPQGFQAAGAKKPRLEWQSTRWQPHDYDSNSSCFLLEKEDVDNSGLPVVRTMLYCRPRFHDQFEFLREKVLEKGHVGWILGPPGTGKSSTAMAFASTVKRSEWIVTWIHVGSHLGWRCVRLIGDERKSRVVDISDVDEVLAVEDTKRHLVLVDGWTAADTLTQKCHDWFLRDEDRRRLAFVCSVGCRGKVPENVQILTRALEFHVWSWTLDEYLSAIEGDDVYQNVLQKLDAPPVLPGEEMSRAAVTKSKYYYAGGSCRYMFLYDCATVKEKLKAAVAALPNAAAAGTSGQRSSSSINRLFGMFEDPDGMGEVWPVISQYAATLIGIKCGAKAIKWLMSTHRESSNPALDGWMLELVFFASLRHSGINLVDEAGNTATWGKAEPVVTDGISALPSDRPIWIKPRKWNQGGYDAIMVCKRKELVRFVQITRAQTHSFHIEFFNAWLDMLLKSPQSFEIKTLEIFFVVEQQQLSTFEIGKVRGQGALGAFEGWEKFKEKGKVEVVGIRGLYDLSQ